MRQHLIRTAIVIAKQPVPGRVKTRLTPPLTAAEAADVAAAALADTLRAVDSLPVTERVLAFDGEAASWTPPGWRTTAQPSGGLDTRLAAAFAAAVPNGPVVLVGMDTPQLRPEQLSAWRPDEFDACLGPAADGGFWAIGFANPARAVDAIPGVPMSSAQTGAIQLDRLRTLGLRVQLLDELTDVDTVETADEVARLAPDTEFAHVYSKCAAAVR